MIAEQIRNSLETWKKDEIYLNSKNFKEHSSPIVPDELYFTLTQSHKITLLGNSKTVTLSQKFHTTTLSVDPISANPKADLYRLERILTSFDEDFIKQVEIEVSKMLQEINPDGFFS